jgi:hypothetical protein
MPTLNDADNIMGGTSQVDKVYAGTNLVWELGGGVVLDPVPTQILAETPLFYFRFGESSGNPVDSGPSNRSTALVMPYTYGQTGALAGDSNTALLLSGGTISMNAISMPGSQTRLAWIKTTETDSTAGYTGDPAMVLLGDSTGNVWDNFGVHGGKVQYRRFNNSTWQTFTGATNVNDGNYHQIGMTYDSTTRAVVLYVDGASDGGGTQTSHQNQGGINKIGVGYDAVDTFRGTVDELAAFSSAKSAQFFADLWTKSQTG